LKCHLICQTAKSTGITENTSEGHGLSESYDLDRYSGEKQEK
jgi:hypothetical protein